MPKFIRTYPISQLSETIEMPGLVRFLSVYVDHSAVGYQVCAVVDPSKPLQIVVLHGCVGGSELPHDIGDWEYIGATSVRHESWPVHFFGKVVPRAES